MLADPVAQYHAIVAKLDAFVSSQDDLGSPYATSLVSQLAAVFPSALPLLLQDPGVVDTFVTRTTAGFVDRVVLYSGSGVQIRVHLFADQPRGSDWIHSHGQSFWSILLSGAYTHRIWNHSGSSGGASTMDLSYSPQDPIALSLGSDLPFRPYVRTKNGDFSPLPSITSTAGSTTGSDGDSVALLSNTFSHRRGPGSLMYLRYSALHTITDFQSPPALPAATLLVRCSSKVPGPTPYFIPPMDSVPSTPDVSDMTSTQRAAALAVLSSLFPVVS